MLNTHDHIPLCSCFDGAASLERAERSVERLSFSSPSALRAPRSSETAPFLRPGVDCLQRWLDLNA